MESLSHPIQNDETYKKFFQICETLELNPFIIEIHKLRLAVAHIRFLWQYLEPKIAASAEGFQQINQHRVEHLAMIYELRSFSGEPELESPGNYNTLDRFARFFTCGDSALSSTLRPAMSVYRQMYLDNLTDLKGRIKTAIETKVSDAASLIIQVGKVDRAGKETIDTANLVLANFPGTPEAKIWEEILTVHGFSIS